MSVVDCKATRRGTDHPHRTGAYYFLPLPGEPTCRWDVVTCHNLGRGADVGHRRLWPEVVQRLAQAWGKGHETLVRLLREHYAGLPRGRVTRVRGVYLVQHGDDTPVTGGLKTVEEQFGLVGFRVRHLLDEHEQMLAGDPKRVQQALGVNLGLNGV
jgi:hypothetical protein